MKNLLATAAVMVALVPAHALERDLQALDGFAMVLTGLVECHSRDFLGRPDVGKVFDRLMGYVSQYSESERHAAGKKAYAMVAEDKTRFCEAVASVMLQRTFPK